MGRIIHFEIHATDVERAKHFYGEVFGWSFEDWSEYAGMPYYGVTTGEDGELGINGAIMERRGAAPAAGQALNAYACTIGTDNLDRDEKRILDLGGTIALPKHALPGMAWQAYYLDTEGNVFGLHEPDTNAK